MIADAREKYEFLKEHVPKSAGNLFVQCSSLLMDKRKDVLSAHRTIALSPLLLNAQVTSKRLVNYNLSTFVLSPAVAEPPIEISPRYVQQATGFLVYLHQNPNQIVESLIDISKKPNVHKWRFIGSCAIPCLFGYFSSQEHLNLAMSFYVGIVSRCEVALATQILLPFFNAPCMYGFLDSALGPFFDRLLKDKRPVNPAITKFYANDLKTLITSSSSLIPQTHKVIMKMMKTRWGVAKACAVVCGVFLKSMALSWLTYMCRTEVAEVLVQVWKDLPVEEILDAMCEKESLFEVPSQYNVFEDPFIMFLVSPMEILSLYKLVTRKFELPAMFNVIQEENVDAEFVFWMKTYPKHEMPPGIAYRNLVFPKWTIEVPENDEFLRQWRAVENLADEREREPFELVESMNFDSGFKDYCLLTSLSKLNSGARDFEKYILFEWHLTVTNKWLEAANAHEQFILAPILERLSQGHDSESIVDAFTQASLLVHSRSNLQFLYLVTVRRLLPKIIEPYSSELEMIRSRWMSVIEGESQSLESYQTQESNAVAAVFFRVTERIGGLGSEELPFQFQSLMTALELLHHLPQKEKIEDRIRMAILFAKMTSDSMDSLVFLFLVLNTLGMGVENFRELCTEIEHRYWINFQKVMFSLIMKDVVLSEVFFMMQTTLIPDGSK